MKKLYTLAIVLMASSAMFAQSQRLTLLEEFTQASCGPCASQNPALNTLLSANEAKTVSVKYQTNWPGVDPMNAQTQTWVGPRVSYYAVSGVPAIKFDGNVALAGTAPNALTQTAINNRYAVTSPFDINVTHAFNINHDSIYVSVEIIATGAAAGAFYLQTALVEEEIIFCAPPGTNGEEDFYSVMRKMLPNATGTLLSNSWTVGQSQTIQFTTSVPTYLYDLKQLAIIAFVQNNTTKEVFQTGISNPLPIANDASLKDCNAGNIEITCVGTYDFSFTLKNDGASTLSTADFSYTVGGNTNTYTWNGSLATGSSTTINLPTSTLLGGSNVFTCNVTSANGNADYVTGNNTFSKVVVYNSVATAAPIVQGYTMTTFPPANWNVINNGAAAGWARSTVGAIAVNGSAKMDLWNSPAGDIDDMVCPYLDLSSITSPVINFIVSKASYTNYFDRLDVVVSTDCGTTWTSVWNKSDPALTTAGAVTNAAFTPTSGNAAQWRAESVSLSAYAGQTNLLVAFRATSDYGNNLYIDDVNITSAVGVNENSLEQQISLFPIPSNGDVFLNLSVIKDNTVRISINDVTGKTIETYTAAKSNQHKVVMNQLQDGTYFIQIDADGQRIIKKVVLNK